MTRQEQILLAIELLEEVKANVLSNVMAERNYRSSVENLVVESISRQEKIQEKINQLNGELEKVGKKNGTSKITNYPTTRI